MCAKRSPRVPAWLAALKWLDPIPSFCIALNSHAHFQAGAVPRRGASVSDVCQIESVPGRPVAGAAARAWQTCSGRGTKIYA